ncbi:MAG: ankyrin repeat domain-containing protein, partial [Candidatus Saccharibacteria bacterium]|nr:ankyrin repeat domain-containing protein [Candidatus Saccharibacteria bacterium]
WLLEHGAKVTATAGHGETALHFAAQEGHADIIRALIASGADVYARDGSGKTALDVATAKGKEACISPLRQAMENKE